MENLTQLQTMVEDVIRYSQEYTFPIDMTETLKLWEERKKPYLEKFGGPILRITDEPIEFTLTSQEKNCRFQQFLADLDGEDLLTQSEEDDYTFEDFLRENKEGFFENRVKVDHPSLKIKSGMKLLKCFKYFLPSFQATRTAQDFASRYIQENKITGHLYLSVHPLDYLTISDNNSHWRSCHSLDGEFRAGNLNYMVDETTIVAYLAPEEQVQLKSFPQGLLWNNKTWRMLIHTNDFKSIIYYNRPYPFDSDSLVEMFGNYITNTLILFPLFKNPEVIGFKNFFVGKKSVSSDYNYIYCPERECIYDMRDVIDESESRGYTDLIYSSYFVPVASTLMNGDYKQTCFSTFEKESWDEAFHKEFDIQIGRDCKCVCCGNNYIEREDSFLCEDCIAEYDLDESDYMKCSCCGRRIYETDKSYMVDEELLCKVCYEASKQERDYPVNARRNTLREAIERIIGGNYNGKERRDRTR